MASMITMDTFNSRKTIATKFNNSSIASKIKLYRIILDTTLDHYLYIGNNIARCSVRVWLCIVSDKHTYYCFSCNVNMYVLCYRTFHQVSDLLSQKITLKHKYTQLINRYINKKTVD